MKKDIIFILLNQFADWEAAFLAPVLTNGINIEPVKTLSITK